MAKTTLREGDKKTKTKAVQPKTAKSSDEQPARPKHFAMPATIRVLISFIFLSLFAIFLTWLIYYYQYGQDHEVANNFISEHQVIFWYSAAVVFVIESLIAVILWRPFLAMAISYSVTSIIMFAFIEKFKARGEPLLPEDFLFIGNAGEMADFVDAGQIISLTIGVICLIVGAIILEIALRCILGNSRKVLRWWERHSIIPRFTFAAAILAIFSVVTSPFVQRQVNDYEWLDDTHFTEWNPIEDYENNGFIISFLHSLGHNTTGEPENYSEEAVTAVYSKYNLQDSSLTQLSDIADNVIVILAESFFDPSILLDYTYAHNGDVTPNLHRIMQEHPSGYMYSKSYGGGTADIEAQIFTGLNTLWTNSIMYTHAIARTYGFPSLVSDAKNQGYKTTALHQYNGGMYKRRVAYNNMLFDEFLDEKTLTYTEPENGHGYISDREAYREILSILENSDQNFISTVTMQNHLPYELPQYPDRNFPLYYPWLANQSDTIESYFELLNHSDQYLGEFIDALDQLDERTIVIWYGDHSGAVFDEYATSSEYQYVDNVHLTPYFIYSNFDYELNLYDEQELAEAITNQGFGYLLETDNNISLPITSANCVSNTFYNLFQIQKPALQNLLDDVCTDNPIIASTYLTGHSLNETTSLADYQLVNFDILAGKQYWLGLNF